MLRTSVWILHQYQNVFQRTFSTNIGRTTCATRVLTYLLTYNDIEIPWNTESCYLSASVFQVALLPTVSRLIISSQLTLRSCGSSHQQRYTNSEGYDSNTQRDRSRDGVDLVAPCGSSHQQPYTNSEVYDSNTMETIHNFYCFVNYLIGVKLGAFSGCQLEGGVNGVAECHQGRWAWEGSGNWVMSLLQI